MSPSRIPGSRASATPVTRIGQAIGKSAATAVVAGRDVIRANPTANTAYRAGVGVVGGATVALGIVLLPLPGPGTLISIGGLGILATEFEGAKKVQTKAIGAARKVVTVVRERRQRPSTPPDSSR